MGINEDYTRTRWRETIARIADQIDDLKARIESESRLLHTKLSAEIAMLQADLRTVEAEVAAAGPDSYARQITAHIEELRAKGDAAYDLLQANMATQLDPTDAEIRRLEALATTVSGDAKANVLAHIDELKAAREAAHAMKHTDERPGHSGNTQP